MPAHALTKTDRGAFLDMAAVYRPRRELQKAAPRNFDAFLNWFFGETKKTVEIPSVRALLFLWVLKRAFCNSRLQQGDPSFACRNQAAETKEETS